MSQLETRLLGRTEISLPVIGFGCGPNAQLMVGEDPTEQLAVAHHAVAVGVNYFDTAAGYGNGRSEINLGQAITELSQKPLISTKVVLEEEDLADVYGTVLSNFEQSLARLRCDAVDALMLHNRVAASRAYKTMGSGCTLSLDDVFGGRGLADALREILSTGGAKSVGFTAFGGEPQAVREMIASGVFHSINASFNCVNPSAGTQVPPGYGDADYESVIDDAREAGMGVMAIRVLSSGSLLRVRDEGSREARIADFASELGEPLVSLAIRYVLSKDGVTTAIMGFSEEAHVDDAVAAAARGPLDRSVTAHLDEIALSGSQ